jgi:hypothetical protein
MVVNAAITPGEEVFNTYGARLSNAELLVRYGFMLDANDNDILTWTIEEIWDAAGAALADSQPRRWDDEASYGVCMEILRDWQYDAGWTDSDLVIDSEPDDENSNPLYMTADGILSHKLWLAIALATLQRQGIKLGVAETRRFLRSVAWAQTQLERGQTKARREGINEDNDDAYRVRARAPDGARPHRLMLTLKLGKNQIIPVDTPNVLAVGHLEPVPSGQRVCACPRRCGIYRRWMGWFERSGNCARDGWIGFSVQTYDSRAIVLLACIAPW